MATEGIVADPNTQPVGDTKPAVQPQPDSKTTVVTPDPGQGTKPGVDDSRVKGLTADLVKERKARQDFENRFKSLETQLAERDRRIAALAGIQTPSAEEAEAEEIRAQFKKVYPKLGNLDDTKIDRLIALADKADSLEQAVNHHWQSYGRTMSDLLYKEVEEQVGGELTERQKRALAASFVQEAESNPEISQQYEQGDTAFLKKFAQEWVEDWLKTAERKVTAQNVNRNRPVPRSGDRSVSTTQTKKIDVNDPKAVEDLLVEGFRERGGQFGRRNRE